MAAQFGNFSQNSLEMLQKSPIHWICEVKGHRKAGSESLLYPLYYVTELSARVETERNYCEQYGQEPVAVAADSRGLTLGVQ